MILALKVMAVLLFCYASWGLWSSTRLGDQLGFGLLLILSVITFFLGKVTVQILTTQVPHREDVNSTFVGFILLWVILNRKEILAIVRRKIPWNW